MRRCRCPLFRIMNHIPEIAIIDPNTLSCMGLQTLLEEIIPMATIRVFHSFGELVDDTPDMYAHYFVSAQIYFEHTAFFRERHPRAIVWPEEKTFRSYRESPPSTSIRMRKHWSSPFSGCTNGDTDTTEANIRNRWSTTFPPAKSKCWCS